VTSGYFARLLSGAVDWLVIVDPHLHWRASLGKIYTVPSAVVHAAPALAGWVRARVERPLVVGPDAESEQWVRSVAEAAGAPYVVLEKERRGDREVEVSVPHVDRYRDHTPVLADDIVSTARTMIETVRHPARAGLPPAVCLGVHAVFAGSAYDDLLAAGAARVVTANTIPHLSNGVDVVPLLAAGVRALTRERAMHRPRA
jgi:ribose-phosphate pyrophosphokinase